VSLLAAPMESVTVYPEESYTDSHGDVRTRPSATGVEVAGWMQPMSATALFPSLDATQQQRIYSTYRFIGRDAPLGVWARVEWADRSFLVRSGPEDRRYSHTTGHITAVLQEER